MASFVDCNSKTWLVRIDVDAIRRVRTKYAIDLAKILGDREAFEKLQDDVCLLVDIIHELCIDQCKVNGIDTTQFAASLSGDALESAVEAFLESALEFLPKSKRLLMEELIKGQKDAQAQAELRIHNAIQRGLITDAISECMTELDRLLATNATNNLAKSTIGN